ncbi:hypothetical protein [Aquimarina algiphila]|uniref:Uncharacterized protein n=1 Tax=Aquimarina algiphila TaxID=2047982 RepID=A0A554VRL7_9FLAO|nr:hypothetical protein [Aquimarina algiphila]TSE11286.1 hypothetical protein FOF46_01260 [Aquimarina algiphila]
MIKKHSIFANWRKKDVDFLANLGITIEEGYFSFLIEEGSVYNEIIKHYTENKGFFVNRTPKEFSSKFAVVEFSMEELDNSKYFVLQNIGKPKGYPFPKNNFDKMTEETYTNYCKKCESNRQQKAPFKIEKEPKLSKNQVNFSFHTIFDEMFFNIDFFQEVLKPLGLKSKEVLIGNTGVPSKNVVQLIIPEAESSLLLDNSVYDINTSCEICDTKKYTQQILGFMPSFKTDFDFLICKTKEFFGETETRQAMRRIIISKEFCDILVKHKIIHYNTNEIYPITNK